MKLSDLITVHSRLSPPQKSALKKLGILTVNDLLYHFPTRYGDTSETKNISSLAKGDDAVIFGKISGLKTSKGFRTKIPMADGYVEDESGKIHCVWFNQPYLAKMVSEGATVRIEGKISERKKNQELYFSNPKIEVVGRLPTGVGESLFAKKNGGDGETHTLYPVYPESRGITSNWMYHKIAEVFRSGLLENLEDSIPDDILKKYSLPGLKTALIWIHSPQKLEDAAAARKRFAFEEVFFIQLEKQQARKKYEKNPSFLINHDDHHIQEFVKRFPFEATAAQQKAIATILGDFKKGHAMSRLLEGDVGSGKTAVAATTAYATVTTRPKGQKFGALQVAYMCPTEILATQHFESFIQFFSYLGVQVGLITGSGCRKFPSKVNPKGWTDISRTQLLKWVENGEIPILIGTHALIQKAVKFKNLAYVIIDEQHRFGLKQRATLVRKDADGLARAPHLLSMTATPIPRTLALTIYGDLDLTLLDQMPHGRKPIITEIVRPDERKKVYEKIRDELQAGRQAYVICPRIDEPDPEKELAINAKSVKEEAKRLKKSVFPEYTIGILHSKMKPSEKDKVMLDFNNGKIKILCATSVVEVGVNVPNATVIILEGAERFGLAQLHQLRGRVIRSNHQAYCFVFAETKSDKTIERLTALKTANNGFELAEYDLKFRGAGELSGGKQWGVTDVAMEALQNIKMVEAARIEAQKLVEDDEELNHWPKVKQMLLLRSKDAKHFE
jgi:ATP-dependent DNA helicase RecG